MATDETENRGWELNAVGGVFLGLAWISVLMRCYVRLRLTNSFQLDDWLMLAAVVSIPFWKMILSRSQANIKSQQVIFTITIAFIIAGVHYGLGGHNRIHNKTLSRANEIEALKVGSTVYFDR